MSVPTLIPVNMLSKAKGRLSEILTPEQRETLTLITLGTVLHAAGPSAIVLTPDERVAEFVDGKARILREVPGRPGLNSQVDHAIEELVGRGIVTDRLLILHADLPLVRSATIEAFVASDPGPNSVTLAESSDGGTNAMLLNPPGKFEVRYGPKSFQLHVMTASDLGLHVHSCQNRELELDLDTPADIDRLLATARGQQTAAGHYLLSIGLGREGEFR
ncbi:MAG TPA: 2-phospho-L-lactate guanylyltransferase [Tepidiformaceae bacterium]|nr:2-phospho-L-lactate guanylyltransferase [Tepidiformaceae bacterium]